MGEVNLGTLYDVNKSLLEKEHSLSEKVLNKKLSDITRFFSRGKYFMLLCHEQRDYTVFQLTTGSKADIATEELKVCMKNRGNILAIDEAPGNAFEIWIKNESGIFAYYLFPYDEAVIIC